MVALLDTSAALAWLDDREPDHREVAAAAEAVRGQIVLTPPVVTEIDYLLGSRFGPEAECRFLMEIESGALGLASFKLADLSAARRVIERYSDLNVGLADASIVALAHRLGARDLLTLDERHFRVLPGSGGEPFRILPADFPE